MKDEEIRHLIQQRAETANLDYKAGFAWTRENRDLKYELIRDLMAMANTMSGGRVIFGVRDADLQFVGVDENVFASVDVTNVLGLLHSNARPNTRCTVYKREIDGKRVVVFDVAEFDETPIICTNGISATDGSRRIILRQGAIYIRTGAATTEEITSPDDMRVLLQRAATRKSDNLAARPSPSISPTHPRRPATADDLAVLQDAYDSGDVDQRIHALK